MNHASARMISALSKAHEGPQSHHYQLARRSQSRHYLWRIRETGTTSPDGKQGAILSTHYVFLLNSLCSANADSPAIYQTFQDDPIHSFGCDGLDIDARDKDPLRPQSYIAKGSSSPLYPIHPGPFMSHLLSECGRLRLNPPMWTRTFASSLLSICCKP